MAINLGLTASRLPVNMPLDVATETLAIIARKGAGKTYTGRVVAEDLLFCGVQTVVIDPLDVWWGLRCGHDGDAAGGFPVVVFGGAHADLPLVETAGKALADLIVDRRLSAVLVLDHLSMGAQRRFVADFAEQLFERKGEQQHRTPLHLMIDEADAFAPQRPTPEAMRCLGAVDRLVRRGRTRGVGTTAITQRPAVLHKDVLTQTEVLITLQVTAPQDQAALSDWIQANADTHQAKAYLGSLASLQRGEAWVWSPSRLQVFERIKVRTARTFDSSYTPKVGESRPATPKLRVVDVEAIRDQLGALIEEAQANDPKALRAIIKRLTKEAEMRPAGKVSVTMDEAYEMVRDRVSLEIAQAESRRDGEWKAALAQCTDRIERSRNGMVQVIDLTTLNLKPSPPPIFKVLRNCAPEPVPAKSLDGFSKAERLILTALAQYPNGRTKVQIALLTGYAHSGGGFCNALSSLRTQGLINPNSEGLSLTDLGRAKTDGVAPLPRGADLWSHWMAQLGKAERAIMETLAVGYPKALSKERLGKAAGYEPNGGGFNNALSRLRTLELIQGRGEICLSHDLMEG